MFKVLMVGVLFFLPRMALAYKWPVIKPVERDILIGDQGEQYLHFDIIGTNGLALYQFECATRSAYNSRDLHYDYTGDFECRMWTPSETRYQTLFMDDPNERDAWHSRARFFAYELYKSCGEYPEFGNARHFKFRGMAIDLRLHNIQFSHEEQVRTAGQLHLSSFRLHVSIRPAPDAKSTIAGRTTALAPPLPDVPADAELSTLDLACRNVQYEPKQELTGEQSLNEIGTKARFPAITSTSANLQIGLDDLQQTLLIRNTAGKPEYKLSCRSEVDAFDEVLIAIDCYLHPVGDAKANVLDTLDPYSLQRRSRFDLDQIRLCDHYPGWGKMREFRVRGMTLVISISKLLESEKQKGSFSKAILAVKATPDEEAISSRVVPAQYIDPGFMPLDRPKVCEPLKVDP